MFSKLCPTAHEILMCVLYFPVASHLRGAVWLVMAVSSQQNDVYFQVRAQKGALTLHGLSSPATASPGVTG